MYQIDCRIFKRERIKPSKENIIIIPGQSKKVEKNQLEFSWQASGVDSSYVAVACRVMLKEWKRVLGEYPICRGFVAVKSDQTYKFYVTFQVSGELEKQEIQRVVSTGMGILQECLVRVSEKVNVRPTNMISELEVTSVDHNLTKVEEVNPMQETIQTNIVDIDLMLKVKTYELQLRDQNQLIDRLNHEIKRQDDVLTEFSENQRRDQFGAISHQEKLMEQVDALKETLQERENQVRVLVEKEKNLGEVNKKLVVEKVQIQKDWQTRCQLLEQKGQTNDAELMHQKANLDDLIRKHQAMSTKLHTSEEINRQLDKANLKLNDTIQKLKVDATKVKYVDKLETRVKELEQDKVELKEQAHQSDRLRQRFEHTNQRLTESLERLENNQTTLVGKAQEDYEALEESLVETEKKLLAETNEKQKYLLEWNKLQELVEKQTVESEQLTQEVVTLTESLSSVTEELEQAKTDELTLQEQKQEDIQEWMEKYDALESDLEESEEQRQNIAIVWEDRYQLLKEKYDELSLESTTYKDELDVLMGQLTQLEEGTQQLNQMPDVYASKARQQMETEQSEHFSYQDYEDDEYDEDDYYYEYDEDLYEEDPYVEDVAVEELENSMKRDQGRDEKDIKKLFEKADNTDYKEVKLEDEDYKKYRLELKFLNFRWNQIYSINNVEKNMDFLNWCLPYVEDVEDFKNSLTTDVKKSLFNKKYVTMDIETLTLLEAYSALSVYLDTYYLKVSSYIDKYFLNEEN